MSEMPLLRHKEERSYVRGLSASVRRFGEGNRFDAIELCCWDCPFDRFYLVQDAEKWWLELDFKVRQRQILLELRFHGSHNSEVFALAQRDSDLFFTAVLENCTLYEPSIAIGVASSVAF